MLAAKRLKADPALAALAGGVSVASAWHPTAPVYPYCHRDTQRIYTPHHADESRFVYEDTPFAPLCKGGEGSGKSVAGIIKTLERLRRGMSGIMVSPDLPHFRRSLWDEFKRWCPPDALIADHRYRLRFDWQPSAPFTLAFATGATLICGGIEDPGSYEGPNVHFAYFDEARRHLTPTALKVLTGRARLVGPSGEPPQVFLTTTPRKHWLYDYYGPLHTDGVDDLASFKARSLVITLRTAENAANLAASFLDDRRSSLTAAEAREVLDAEWEDVDGTARFIPSLTWWDACYEDLPPLDAHTPIVIALDAGEVSDTFALVGTSRHPDPDRWHDAAVRLVRVWDPNGTPLDFDAIEREIIETILDRYNVVQICYDRYQLRQMTQRLSSRAWCVEFSQATDRLIADKHLYDLIQSRHIAHDGNALLRSHVDNADRKVESQDRMRIVKRRDSLKVDAVVSLSMSAYRMLTEFQ